MRYGVLTPEGSFYSVVDERERVCLHYHAAYLGGTSHHSGVQADLYIQTAAMLGTPFKDPE